MAPRNDHDTSSFFFCFATVPPHACDATGAPNRSCITKPTHVKRSNTNYTLQSPIHSLRQQMSSQSCRPSGQSGPDHAPGQKPSAFVCSTHGHRASNPAPQGQGRVPCSLACKPAESPAGISSSGKASASLRSACLYRTRATSSRSSRPSSSSSSESSASRGRLRSSQLIHVFVLIFYPLSTKSP